MMLAHGKLRVSHVSTHIPLSRAAQYVTPERVRRVVTLTREALQKTGLSNPKIAVAAFNPHAGEGGLIGTEDDDVLVPTVTAATALSRRRPEDALTALDVAVPAERGNVAGLVAPFLRGEALLARGDAEKARGEYEKVLNWRGADPFAPVVPLAHLGMARAWAAAGDAAKSRKAYEELFRIWARADPDLPVLTRARAEHARLSSSPLSPD
jgi:predicted Zn-dependent protease